MKQLKFLPIIGLFFAKDYVQGDTKVREPLRYWLYQWICVIVGAILYILFA